MLPSFLQFLAAFGINNDFKTVPTILAPVITAQRRIVNQSKSDQPAYLNFFLEAVDDDQRAAGKLLRHVNPVAC